jgi:hypothetical protein
MARLPSPLLEVPPVRHGALIVRAPNSTTRRDLAQKYQGRAEGTKGPTDPCAILSLTDD